MTIEEFYELLKYIMENNSWDKMYENCYVEKKNNPIAKYVSFSLDTRDGSIWCVTFKDIENGDISFRTEQDYNFKETIYKYLKGKKGIGRLNNE